IIYQPICAGCRACVPIRVPVAQFLASKSQRRVLRKNPDVLVRGDYPSPTQGEWGVYQRYQRAWDGKGAHDADESADDLPSFLAFLYQSPVDTLEFEYRSPLPPHKLMGVGICDITAGAISSVYFYFDPREHRRSLGTYSALYEIEYARENGR